MGYLLNQIHVVVHYQPHTRLLPLLNDRNSTLHLPDPAGCFGGRARVGCSLFKENGEN